MNVTLDFADFLRTGTLGGLRCGMTKQDVMALWWGKPEKPGRVENYATGQSVWTYGPVEIRFSEELIEDIGIGFTWWDDLTPTWMNLYGFFPRKDTKMAEIRALISERKIGFERGKEERALRTVGGVWVFATNEDTIMSAVRQCPGPNAFFDERYRVRKD